jgi:photosystem II stability/assembly factor-like uncharacterized protein
MRRKALAGVVVVVMVGLFGVGLRISSPQRVQAADDVQGQWVSVGPSPVTRSSFNGRSNPKAPGSGRIGSIAVDRTNLAHWLLGVGNGGVWESRDAGGSWVPLTDAAPTLATGDVTFDPTNPQTIYVGTGEAHGGGVAMGGMGILKSTDGGRTWAVVGAASFARGSVRRLRVNPGKPSELVAASTRGGFGRQAQDFPQSPPPYGVLKSSDAGQTWVRTLSGQATALEIDPANFNRQYAAIGENRLDLPTDLNRAGTDVTANGLYRSTDAGQHWDSIAGPWGASSSTQLLTGRIELALAPSNPNVVYASLSQPDGNRILGLYRTDNAWADVPTWRQISIAQTAVDVNNFSPGSYCSNCNYAHVISVNPSDPDMLFCRRQSAALAMHELRVDGAAMEARQYDDDRHMGRSARDRVGREPFDPRKRRRGLQHNRPGCNLAEPQRFDRDGHVLQRCAAPHRSGFHDRRQSRPRIHDPARRFIRLG